MLSALSSVLTISSYLKYKYESNKYNLVKNAESLDISQDTSKPKYITGFLSSNQTFTHKNQSYLTQEINKYNIYKKIVVNKNSAYDTTEERHDSNNYTPVQSVFLSGLNINYLLKKIHDQYKTHIDTNTKPSDNYLDSSCNLNINLNTSDLNISNKVLVAHKYVNHGLLLDNSSYTIVGRFNGREFYDRVIIKKNQDITSIRQEYKDNTDFWFYLTSISLVCTCITGALEYNYK